METTLKKKFGKHGYDAVRSGKLLMCWWCQQLFAAGDDKRHMCEGCGEAVYCSDECHQRAWPEHQRVCSPALSGKIEKLYKIANILSLPRSRIGAEPPAKKPASSSSSVGPAGPNAPAPAPAAAAAAAAAAAPQQLQLTEEREAELEIDMQIMFELRGQVLPAIVNQGNFSYEDIVALSNATLLGRSLMFMVGPVTIPGNFGAVHMDRSVLRDIPRWRRCSLAADRAIPGLYYVLTHSDMYSVNLSGNASGTVAAASSSSAASAASGSELGLGAQLQQPNGKQKSGQKSQPAEEIKAVRLCGLAQGDFGMVEFSKCQVDAASRMIYIRYANPSSGGGGWMRAARVVDSMVKYGKVPDDAIFDGSTMSRSMAIPGIRFGSSAACPFGIFVFEMLGMGLYAITLVNTVREKKEFVRFAVPIEVATARITLLANFTAERADLVMVVPNDFKSEIIPTETDVAGLVGKEYADRFAFRVIRADVPEFSCIDPSSGTVFSFNPPAGVDVKTERAPVDVVIRIAPPGSDVLNDHIHGTAQCPPGTDLTTIGISHDGFTFVALCQLRTAPSQVVQTIVSLSTASPRVPQ